MELDQEPGTFKTVGETLGYYTENAVQQQIVLLLSLLPTHRNLQACPKSTTLFFEELQLL